MKRNTYILGTGTPFCNDIGSPISFGGMTIGQRVRRARNHAGLTQAKLAKAVGLRQATISELEKGESRSSAYLVHIAKACGVSAHWLATGEGDMLGKVTELRPSYRPEKDEVEFFGHLDPWDSDTPLDPEEVELPLFREVEIAAGTGRTEVVENHGAKLRFARSTLRRAGVTKEHAACAYVSGDSMEPVLPDGTTVGVNTADTRVVDGKLYVIDHDGLLRVKQLHRLPGGGLRIRSFNQAEFPDEDLGPEWPERVRIKGKVFWSSTMW